MSDRLDSGGSSWSSRLLVSLFVLGVVAFLAVASVADIRDVPSEDRTSAALFGGAAWLISFAAGAALTFLHARRGTLILRERAAREANRQRIRAMNPTKLIVPGDRDSPHYRIPLPERRTRMVRPARRLSSGIHPRHSVDSHYQPGIRHSSPEGRTYRHPDLSFSLELPAGARVLSDLPSLIVLEPLASEGHEPTVTVSSEALPEGL